MVRTCLSFESGGATCHQRCCYRGFCEGSKQVAGRDGGTALFALSQSRTAILAAIAGLVVSSLSGNRFAVTLSQAAESRLGCYSGLHSDGRKLRRSFLFTFRGEN